MIHDINNPTVKREGGGKKGQKAIDKGATCPYIVGN